MIDYVWKMSAVASLAIASIASGREWHDASGTYQVEAELIAYDDESVVLQRSDDELGVLKISQLCPEDQAFLKSKDAKAIRRRNVEAKHVWTTQSGLKLVGRVVDYARADVTVQRRRGKLYVNDRRYENLPDIYQQLLLKVIEHFDGADVSTEVALRKWLRGLGGRPRTFHVEGVKLEMESGDEYPIPFFVFAEDDRRILEAGWSEWLPVQGDYDARDDIAFRLESIAAAHLRNQEIQNQIALIDLNLQAVRAGLTSVWEVTLYPVSGNSSPPRWALAPGRSSAEATAAALHNHPGFVAGPVRRLSR